MLYYTILYDTAFYTILYYIILHILYYILYYIILYYTITTILWYTILYYTILYNTILYYTILFGCIIYYIIIQLRNLRALEALNLRLHIGHPSEPWECAWWGQSLRARWRLPSSFTPAKGCEDRRTSLARAQVLTAWGILRVEGSPMGELRFGPPGNN